MKKTILLNALMVLGTVAIIVGCARSDVDQSVGFMLSTGDMLALNSLHGADTTIKISVRADNKWIIDSKPEWVDVTPDTHLSSYTLITAKIQQNKTIDSREGAIVFRFNDKSTKELKVVQLGTGGSIKVIQPRHDVNFNTQQIPVDIITNLVDMRVLIISSSANWIEATLTLENEPVGYKCNVNITTENNDSEIRTAKIAISGADARGTILSDTIYVSQMYNVEELKASVVNDEGGFTYSWTHSSNPAITYYELNIANQSGSILSSYDVSSLSSINLDTCKIIRDISKDSYIGNINISVLGKSTASATSVIAQTNNVTTGSFFADGDGSAASPFKVSCSRHFNNIARLRLLGGGSEVDPHDALQIMSKNFLQTADIVFASVTNPEAKTLNNSNVNIIGDAVTPFMGVYDGGSYSLSNIYIVSNAQYVGIFGLVGSSSSTSANSIVTNVNAAIKYIEGRADEIDTEEQAKSVGGIVGAIAKGSVTNCTVKAHDVNSALFANNRTAVGTTPQNASYKGYAGGVVGIASGNIINCANLGLWVISRRVAGGVTGGQSASLLAAGSYSISKCYNLAKVSLGHTGQTYPMGIAIAAEAGDYSAEHCAAGIAGNIIGASGALNKLNVIQCYNAGDITSEKFAGGIAGRTHFSDIKMCYNYGRIKTIRNSDNIITAQRIAAGIIAWGNNNANTTEVCYNIGQIECSDAHSGTEGAGVITLGGIMGNAGAGAGAKMNNVICLDQINPILTGQKYVGAGASTGIIAATCKVESSANMQNLAKYPSAFDSSDWFFATESGYLYPQLVAFPHTTKD